MTIDVKSELERMVKQFDVSEREVSTNFRGAVRSMWGDSIFKRVFYEKHMVEMVNTNPRSMKRFPTVKCYQCAICEGWFSSNETELDHIDGENQMLSLDDAESFLKSIVFPEYSGLRILCKDKKSKVKGKSVTTRLGCHGIDTYSQRYNVTFDYAKRYKHYLLLTKQPDKLLDKLNEFKVESIPTTKVGKERLLKQLLNLN